jgi:fermentation-respiration switch protein FrsA (DUF1100 family)
MLDRARFLFQAGYSVLLFDLQAHGESLGSHITFGHLESRDAQAAVNFLRAEFPEKRIGVIGVSLGGASAVLASPPLEVDALVLEMVYPTVEQAIRNRLTMRLGSWSGVLTPLFSWQLKPRLGITADDLRPIDELGKIEAPILFIAGAGDRHTTLEETYQMYNAARGIREIYVVRGAGHVDLHAVTPDEYSSRVLAFLAKYLRSDEVEVKH